MGTHATPASCTSREGLWMRTSDAVGRGQAWTQAAWHTHAWSPHACVGEARCIGASSAWPVQCTRAQESVQRMCVHGWYSACLQTVGVVHACAWPVQCMHLQSGCSACMCHASAVHVCMADAVHACAWLVQCMCAQCWCSSCMGATGAVFTVCSVPACPHACTRSAQCTCVYGWCPDAQHELGGGRQGLGSPTTS